MTPQPKLLPSALTGSQVRSRPRALSCATSEPGVFLMPAACVFGAAGVPA